jgi:hypothetical protein
MNHNERVAEVIADARKAMLRNGGTANPPELVGYLAASVVELQDQLRRRRAQVGIIDKG